MDISCRSPLYIGVLIVPLKVTQDFMLRDITLHLKQHKPPRRLSDLDLTLCRQTTHQCVVEDLILLDKSLCIHYYKRNMY